MDYVHYNYKANNKFTNNESTIILYFPFNQYLTTDEPGIIFDKSPSKKTYIDMYITITEYQYITKCHTQSLISSELPVSKYSLAIMDL